MSLSENVNESCSKLKTTPFSLVNSGVNDSGFKPITSFHLYRSIVLPKGLYGAELWNCRYLQVRKKCLNERTDFV